MIGEPIWKLCAMPSEEQATCGSSTTVSQQKSFNSTALHFWTPLETTTATGKAEYCRRARPARPVMSTLMFRCQLCLDLPPLQMHEEPGRRQMNGAGTSKVAIYGKLNGRGSLIRAGRLRDGRSQVRTVGGLQELTSGGRLPHQRQDEKFFGAWLGSKKIIAKLY